MSPPSRTSSAEPGKPPPPPPPRRELGRPRWVRRPPHLLVGRKPDPRPAPPGRSRQRQQAGGGTGRSGSGPTTTGGNRSTSRREKKQPPTATVLPGSARHRGRRHVAVTTTNPLRRTRFVPSVSPSRSKTTFPITARGRACREEARAQAAAANRRPVPPFPQHPRGPMGGRGGAAGRP